MMSKRTQQIISTTLLAMSLLMVNPTASTASSDVKPKILLDMAHKDTENDVGASYMYWNERDIVNPITEKVANKLVNMGYSVTLTRDYDTPISINDRVALANRTDYDYYVSIHANSCETPNTGTGIEAYYNGNAAQILAEGMLEGLQELGLYNRGNYETPYYTAYIHDSVLLEIGFVNNWQDRKIIFENEDKIVDIIANNIDAAYKANNLSQN